MKTFALALSALSLLAGNAPALAAAPCKDKQGKFMKCPAKPEACRDAKGHYMRCR